MESIKKLWDEIDADEASLDKRKWLLAEALAEKAAEGMSTRQIASDTGRSQTTVRRWITIWKEHGESAPTRMFSECYYEVEGRTRKDVNEQAEKRAARKFLKEASTEEIEQELLNLPERRRMDLYRGISETHPAQTMKAPPAEPRERWKAPVILSSAESLVRLQDGIDKVRAYWESIADDESVTVDERGVFAYEVECSLELLQKLYDEIAETVED